MSGSITLKPRVGAGFAAVALVAAMLGGCSDRDASGAEKIAAINAAAERAEKAATRAEEAAAKIEKLNQPTVIEVDPDATEDAADAGEAEVADQNEPLAPDADIKNKG